MARSLAEQYSDMSQEVIHEAVCRLTDQILTLRNAKGYGKQAELQRARRDRSELQALLTRPTLVWVNPATSPAI